MPNGVSYHWTFYKNLIKGVYFRMEKLVPKLFTCLKTYSKEQLVKDIISGIIVAIIALPLSIALALASGVTPEKGIYTAIIAGFVISFLGGSKVQISGPTAAFATIVAGIIAQYGMNGLVLATIMAGLILVLMGLFRLGNLIKFIPYTITTGFTAGIAVTIFIGQLKDFFGLTIHSKEPLIETTSKFIAAMKAMDTLNWQALLVGLISIAILIIWPRLFSRIPASLIAVIAGILCVRFLPLKVNTIGDLYQISNHLPSFHFPTLSLHQISIMLPSAFTIAILASIESLLSCVVSDSMINGKHRSNMELIAQGTGNIASALFGGIPATGAIARTAANVKNGGRTPVSGMVHSVVLLLILVVLMPYAALIPMPTIAAILFIVAYNMSGWRQFLSLLKKSPKSDITVLVVTFILTVFFDLVVAIEIGLALAVVLFMKRMSDETEVASWIYADEEEDADSLSLRTVPEGTFVYEITGPLFFGMTDKILSITLNEQDHCLILRMRGVNALDASGLHALDQLFESCKAKDIYLILVHVNQQPMKVMEKAGFIDKLGSNFIQPHIDDALSFAETLVSHKQKKKKGALSNIY